MNDESTTDSGEAIVHEHDCSWCGLLCDCGKSPDDCPGCRNCQEYDWLAFGKHQPVPGPTP